MHRSCVGPDPFAINGILPNDSTPATAALLANYGRGSNRIVSHLPTAYAILSVHNYRHLHHLIGGT